MHVLTTVAAVLVLSSSTALAVDLNKIGIDVRSVERVYTPTNPCLGSALEGTSKPCPTGTMVLVYVFNGTPFHLSKVTLACSAYDTQGRWAHQQTTETNYIQPRDLGIAVTWFPLDPLVGDVRCAATGAAQK